MLQVKQIVDVIYSIIADSLSDCIGAVLHDVVPEFVRVAVLEVRIWVNVRLDVTVESS